MKNFILSITLCFLSATSIWAQLIDGPLFKLNNYSIQPIGQTTKYLFSVNTMLNGGKYEIYKTDIENGYTELIDLKKVYPHSYGLSENFIFALERHTIKKTRPIDIWKYNIEDFNDSEKISLFSDELHPQIYVDDDHIIAWGRNSKILKKIDFNLQTVWEKDFSDLFRDDSGNEIKPRFTQYDTTANYMIIEIVAAPKNKKLFKNPNTIENASLFALVIDEKGEEGLYPLAFDINQKYSVGVSKYFIDQQSNELVGNYEVALTDQEGIRRSGHVFGAWKLSTGKLSKFNTIILNNLITEERKPELFDYFKDFYSNNDYKLEYLSQRMVLKQFFRLKDDKAFLCVYSFTKEGGNVKYLVCLDENGEKIWEDVTKLGGKKNFLNDEFNLISICNFSPSEYDKDGVYLADVSEKGVGKLVYVIRDLSSGEILERSVIKDLKGLTKSYRPFSATVYNKETNSIFILQPKSTMKYYYQILRLDD